MFINDWGSNPNERIYHIADFIKNFSSLKTHIIGRYYDWMPNRDDLQTVDVSFIDSKKYTKSKIRSYLLRCIIIWKAFRSIINKRPQFLYIRSLYFSLIFGIFRPFFNYQIIYETHGFSYKEQQYKKAYRKANIIKYIESFNLNKLVSYVVTNTPFLAREIEIHFPFKGKAFPIMNGLDFSEFEPDKKTDIKKRDKFWLGFIGNWEHWIAIEDLLKISEMQDDYTIVIVGEGYNYHEMREKYHKVNFIGKVPKQKALEYLFLFDCCISPWSEDKVFREKSARKTYEYLAAGKPIIVSDVPGKEDFLINEKHCLLYEPGNAGALLNAVNTLYNNKSLQKQISENNRQLAYEYTWEEIIKRSGLNTIFNKKI